MTVIDWNLPCDPLTLVERQSLVGRIGRLGAAQCQVAARCPAGHPAVLRCHPVRCDRGKLVPFPTLDWLICPRLARLLAQLEQIGVIEQLQQRLDGDALLRNQLAADHQRAARQRWALLNPAEQTHAQSAGWSAVLRDRGLGGSLRRDTVKCLHMHYAQHMVDGNTLGRLLAQGWNIHPCEA